MLCCIQSNYRNESVYQSFRPQKKKKNIRSINCPTVALSHCFSDFGKLFYTFLHKILTNKFPSLNSIAIYKIMSLIHLMAMLMPFSNKWTMKYDFSLHCTALRLIRWCIFLYIRFVFKWDENRRELYYLYRYPLTGFQWACLQCARYAVPCRVEMKYAPICTHRICTTHRCILSSGWVNEKHRRCRRHYKGHSYDDVKIWTFLLLISCVSNAFCISISCV